MRAFCRRIAGWTTGVVAGAAAVAGGCATRDAASSRPAEPLRFAYARVLMGVDARVVLYAPSEAAAESAAAAAFARIAELDAAMSDYRDDSELVRLGEASGGPPRKVSEDLYRVLARAQEISAASDGAFDATVGPLVALWRRARKAGAPPSEAEIAQARERVGWARVEMSPELRTVALRGAGMRLDLGGIAKGYACDRAVERLRERGCASCLVSLAGDVVAGDAPPGRDAWTVAVEGADPPSVEIANAAVSTSGDAAQFVEAGGVRYSHVVDPRTGVGVTSRVEATVIAPDGATADALATAVCVLGRERGHALVAKFAGARAIVRVRHDDEPGPPRF